MVRRVVPVVWLAACGFHGPPRQAPDVDAPGGSAGVGFVIEAEMFSSSTLVEGFGWMQATDEVGYSGTSFMQSPTAGRSCMDQREAPSCPALTYQLTVQQPGTYFFHARMLARTLFDDSIWYGLDAITAPSVLTAGGPGGWRWRSGAAFQVDAGSHTLYVWQREHGARIDIVALTTSAQPPV